MALIHEPQAWVSFATLALLEIVLGIDNIIFLTILVERLPQASRRSARLLGLSFAMLTRLALLFSITWLATMTAPLVSVHGWAGSGRDLILFAGGLFLCVKSVMEIRAMQSGRRKPHKAGRMNRFWPVVLQIGILDMVFSLDSVFSAVGLASRIEVMVAAIVAAVLVMMWASAMIGGFIDRHSSIKVLALVFLALVGATLMAEGLELNPPKGYLYFALGFAATVEWINIRVRRSSTLQSGHRK